jgi:hypothetical protein
MAFEAHPFGDLFETRKRKEKANMPYEVQQNTITDGWINNWFYDAGDGVMRPETFATPQEAQAALDEHLTDLEEEFSLPYVNRYLHDEFRIRYVPDASPGTNPHQQGTTP